MLTRFRRPRHSRADAPSVVILGGGYGGIYAALELQRAAKRGEINLTLISRENFFLFQPMLAEVISGGIGPLNVVSPIRRIVRRAAFHQAEVEAIDADAQRIAIRYPGHARLDYVDYDYLIIAVGSATDLSQFPGVQEHAMTFKTLGDAFQLRNHLLSMLEAADVERDPAEKRKALTFVVAGGGYTGVEVASETNEFVRAASKSYRNVGPGDYKVILLHRSARILPELGVKLAAFSHRLLEKRGIEVRLNASLQSATAQSAILAGGDAIPTRTLVATVGASPNVLLDDLPCEHWRGRLVADETLKVHDIQNTWAVGDCALVPNAQSGQPCPPTAQFARQQAKIAARNILATIDGRPTTPFRHKNRGVFVPLGRFAAAAEAFGLDFSGVPAWWMYRSFYLAQLPRIERKLRIVTDWTLDLIFPSDIVKVDIAQPRGATRARYEAGEYIYRQGEIAHEFYIILSGDVEISRHHDGRNWLVASLTAGEYFGEMALLNNERRSSSARALNHAELLIMTGEDFTALASSSSLFGDLLNQVMSERNRDNAEADDSVDRDPTL